jgi:hypothetical protein
MAATERYNLFVGTLIVIRIKNNWWLPTKPNKRGLANMIRGQIKG